MKHYFDVEEKLEKILHILNDLASELAKGTPIIVEGKRDVEALNELEVKGDYITAMNRSENLLELLSEVEKYGKDEVILLMDFDQKGRELTRYVMRHLENMKIKPNVIFWKEISSLLRRDIKDIEGLPAYLKTMKRKIGKGIE